MSLIQSHPAAAGSAAQPPFALAGQGADGAAGDGLDALFAQLLQQVQAQLQKLEGAGEALPIDGDSLPPEMIRADLRAELEAHLQSDRAERAALTEEQLDELVTQAVARLQALPETVDAEAVANGNGLPFVLSEQAPVDERSERAAAAVDRRPLPDGERAAQDSEDAQASGSERAVAVRADRTAADEAPGEQASRVTERSVPVPAAVVAETAPEVAAVAGSERRPLEREVAKAAVATAKPETDGVIEASPTRLAGTGEVTPHTAAVVSGVAAVHANEAADLTKVVPDTVAAARGETKGAEAAGELRLAAGVERPASVLARESAERPVVASPASDGARGDRRPAVEVPSASAERYEFAAQLRDQGAEPASPRPDSGGRSEPALAAAYAKILSAVSPQRSEAAALVSPPPPGQLQSFYQAAMPQPPVLALPQRFGSEGWLPAASQRITWMASQQLGTAELRLDPPELGSLQVRLSLHQDQASLSFTSPNPQVREVLEQQMPRLREMLAESGINLQQSDVSDQGAGRSARQDGNEQRGGSADSVADAVEPGLERPQQRILSLVDAYA